MKKSTTIFSIPLSLVNDTFSPASFPDIGASTFGNNVIVESPQATANILEAALLQEDGLTPVPELEGLPLVIAKNEDGFIVGNTRTLAHRITDDSLFFDKDYEATLINLMKEHGLAGVAHLDPLALLFGFWYAKDGLEKKLERPDAREIAKGNSSIIGEIVAKNVIRYETGGVKNSLQDREAGEKSNAGQIRFDAVRFADGETTLKVVLDVDLVAARAGDKLAELIYNVGYLAILNIVEGKTLRLRRDYWEVKEPKIRKLGDRFDLQLNRKEIAENIKRLSSELNLGDSRTVKVK